MPFLQVLDGSKEAVCYVEYVCEYLNEFTTYFNQKLLGHLGGCVG